MIEAQLAIQIEHAVHGDQDALQRILIHYHGVLRGKVSGRIRDGYRRHVDPDDVLQRVYVSAFQTVEGRRFADVRRFYRSAERIAVNEVNDTRRRLRREKRDIRREDCADHARPGTASTCPDLLHHLEARDSTPSRMLARTEAVAAIQTCVARLSEERRRVVTLRYLEGRSVAEVAAALGKTESAIHMLCHRGLKRLRELLGAVTDYLSR